MMTARWRIAPRPLTGELFSSLAVRTAHAHAQPAWSFANTLWPGIPAFGRDIDRHPPAALLRDYSDRAGVSEARLRQATLVPETRALTAMLGAPAGGAVTPLAPLLTDLRARHVGRRGHGLGYCAACLRAHPKVFLKLWRYAFVVACPVHRLQLRDACPDCGAALQPHRSSPSTYDRCFACAADLASATQIAADPDALSLQGVLHAELDAMTTANGEDGIGRAAALVLFARLAAVARPWAVRLRLGDALGMPAAPVPSTHNSFDGDRVAIRAETLGLVAAWMDEWPERFHLGASAAGLTRRAFARLNLPQQLAIEVARLPPRSRSHTDKGPRIHDDDMRRLRRKAPEHYRNLRAARLIAASHPTGTTSR